MSEDGIGKVEKLLEVSRALERVIKEDEGQGYQDEGAVNMRDLSRLITLERKFKEEGVDQELSLFHAFEIAYLQRITKLHHPKALTILFESGLIHTQPSLFQA